MVLTEIGAVGIHHAGGDIVLTPSLHCIAKLGSPSEIVQLFYRVVNGGNDFAYIEDCIQVLWACCEDDRLDSLAELTGYRGLNEKGQSVFIPGEMSYQEIAILAQSLMAHGVVGVAEETQGDKPVNGAAYAKEFKAIDFVSIAIAHLGTSEKDAWNMTMTGLLAALKAKYPPEKPKGSIMNPADIPTKEELAAAKAWYRQVKSIRVAEEAARNGK